MTAGTVARPPDHARHTDPPAPPAPPRGRWGHALVIAAAAPLWVAGLAATDVSGTAGYGLVAVLGIPWFAALLLLAGGFLRALADRLVRPGVLAAHTVALAVALHATTPLLYDTPRYAWTFKHVAVSRHILETGAVDRSLDIYNNWPGFFTLAAWLGGASGTDPLALAEWAQVVFSILGLAVVAFALRGLSDDPRVVWGGTWLFVAANWVGQEYFAPQAAAFVLSMLVIGLCLRCAPRGSTPGRPAGIRRAARAGLPPHAPPLPPVAALAVGAAAFLALTVTHQLSPVLVVAMVVALWLVVGRLPWWVPAGMAVIELWWVILAAPFLNGTQSLLSFRLGAAPGPVGEPIGVPMDGSLEIGWASRLTLVLMALAAVTAAVALMRRRAAVWAPGLALMLAPFLVVAMQDYGGEGLLRSYMFALPWQAFLVAAALLRGRRVWAFAAVALLVGALSVTAYFGREHANRIPAGDIASSEWVERTAPAGSVLVSVSGNYPDRVTAGYDRLLLPFGNPIPALVDDPVMREAVARGDAAAVARFMDAMPGTARYLAISDGQEAYLDLYGIVPAGSLPRLRAAVADSERFREVFRRDGATVYRLVAGR